jgi:hypothetical protein
MREQESDKESKKESEKERRTGDGVTPKAFGVTEFKNAR